MVVYMHMMVVELVYYIADDGDGGGVLTQDDGVGSVHTHDGD